MVRVYSSVLALAVAVSAASAREPTDKQLFAKHMLQKVAVFSTGVSDSMYDGISKTFPALNQQMKSFLKLSDKLKEVLLLGASDPYMSIAPACQISGLSIESMTTVVNFINEQPKGKDYYENIRFVTGLKEFSEMFHQKVCNFVFRQGSNDVHLLKSIRLNVSSLGPAKNEYLTAFLEETEQMAVELEDVDSGKLSKVCRLANSATTNLFYLTDLVELREKEIAARLVNEASAFAKFSNVVCGNKAINMYIWLTKIRQTLDREDLKYLLRKVPQLSLRFDVFLERISFMEKTLWHAIVHEQSDLRITAQLAMDSMVYLKNSSDAADPYVEDDQENVSRLISVYMEYEKWVRGVELGLAQQQMISIGAKPKNLAFAKKSLDSLGALIAAFGEDKNNLSNEQITPIYKEAREVYTALIRNFKLAMTGDTSRLLYAIQTCRVMMSVLRRGQKARDRDIVGPKNAETVRRLMKLMEEILAYKP